MLHVRQHLAPLTALLLTIALASCGQRSEEELVASGKGYLAKGDAKAAAVEFKAALQQAPKSGETRLLLGRALLATGDAPAAVVEFRKALDGGYPKQKVAPDLARAMLMLGQTQKLVDEFGGMVIDDATAAADLLTTLGTAHAGLGKIEQARANLASALERKPDLAAALILKSRMMLADGEIDGALAQLAQVLERDPKELVARMLVGDIKLLGKGDPDGAVVEYRKAIEAKPDYVRAHSALVMTFLRQKKYDEARQQIAALNQAVPNHPQARYHEAQLAAIDLDFGKARELALGLLKLAPEHVAFLHLASVVEAQMGNQRQAGQYLTKALLVEPGRGDLRGLLARTYLQLGEPDKAYEVLKPAVEAERAPPALLSLAAEALLQAGDFDRSRDLFQRAAKGNPNDASVQTSLALLSFSTGDREGAIRQLEAISAKAPDTAADQALVSVRARQRDYDGALRAIDAMARKEVHPALPSFLRGQIEQLRGNTGAARQHFEAALAKAPTHLPSLAAVTALDLAAGQFDTAQARYEAALKADPKSSLAMAEIARIRSRAGAGKDEVVKRLNEAIKVDALDPAPRIMLVDYLMSQRDAAGAVQAAQDGVALRGDSLELLERLGRAQLMAGDSLQAISTFRKYAQLQPRAPEPYLQLADVYTRMNDATAAEASLRQALSLAPDSAAIQRRLARHLMLSKKTDAALVIARDMQKQQPKDASGYILESEIQAQARKVDAVVASLRKGLSATDSADIAARLYRALHGAGQTKEAQALVVDWSRSHPKDAVLLRSVGDFEMQRHNYAGAEQRYLEVLRIDADNAPVLNNLAWLRVKQGKPGAREAAQRAVALEPKNPSNLDTLAHALLAEKQLPQAAETARRVIQFPGSNAVLRLSAVEVLIRAGDTKTAEAELDKLAQDKSNAFQQSEVGRLRAMIKR